MGQFGDFRVIFPEQASQRGIFARGLRFVVLVTLHFTDGEVVFPEQFLQ